MPKWIKGVGLLLGFLTLAGLIYGIPNSVFGDGFFALWRHGRAEGWPWWYYVLAVPALGAAGLIAEGVTEAVIAFSPFRWRNDPAPWKRVVFWVVGLITCGVALAFLFSPLWFTNLASANAF